MEKKKEGKFEVEFTSTARIFFFEIVEYLFEHYPFEKAESLSDELLEKALSLDRFFERGAPEPYLKDRIHQYRFIIFERTKRKKIKIIYYVNKKLKKVYVTDFFPTEKDHQNIAKRNQ